MVSRPRCASGAALPVACCSNSAACAAAMRCAARFTVATFDRWQHDVRVIGLVVDQEGELSLVRCVGSISPSVARLASSFLHRREGKARFAPASTSLTLLAQRLGALHVHDRARRGARSTPTARQRTAAAWDAEIRKLPQQHRAAAKPARTGTPPRVCYPRAHPTLRLTRFSRFCS